MLGAFNTVYGALKGFFSRGFWFSVFLPVALFGALHCLIALIQYRTLSLFGIRLSLDSTPLANFAEAAPYLIAAVIVISFAFAPFVNYLRGLLDGSLLPKSLHDWLRGQRYRMARDKKREWDSLRDDLGKVADLYSDYTNDAGRVRTAYNAAVQRNPKTADNVNAAQAARGALQVLERALNGAKPLAPMAGAAVNAVIAALDANAPDIDNPISRETGKVADELEDQLREAVPLAKYRFQIARDRYRVVDAIEYPWATPLGDARFIAEAYPRNAYNVEFDYLWPRLVMMMRAAKGDDPTLEAIENARTNIDFAVLSFFLAITIPLIWLPVLLFRGGPISAWLFLVIGAAAPLMLQFFFRLAFESQLAFAEVVAAAIDRARFVVLGALLVDEPRSRGEERALWGRIRNGGELLYAPRPASPAK
jgi:hypothetical protein